MNASEQPFRPVLTSAARPATYVVHAIDEHGEVRETSIAGEHPLTLYVDKQEVVTLMTLGAAPEALAIGYLRNQRLLSAIEDIVAVQVDWDVNAVVVTTRNGLADLEERLRKRTQTTGCGQGTVFGDLMDEIDAIALPKDAVLTRETLYALLEKVRVHETIYKQAGAVHGCALATNAGAATDILMFVEDVGRHNAVDAIAGQMWLDRIEGARQDLLHDGPAHLRDGDQGRADGDPVPGVALGPDADGPRDRAEGRHDDDRARDQPALPPLHRCAAVPRRRRPGGVGAAARSGIAMTAGITGIVLAGGQGRRMGGVDKGLVELDGKPMVQHVIERFAPQVETLVVNANQNVERYAAFGYPVIADAVGGFAGPLAGLHAGMSAARTPLVATVPCDSPFLPADLVARLARALQERDAQLAVARTLDGAHPVFCLVQRSVLAHLDAFLKGGGRKFDAWYATLRVTEVPFDDELDAFRNVNTRDELAALAARPGGR